MKKTIVQIKGIEWYDTNKDEHGKVFNNPQDDTDFFSRGQTEYCGMIAEVVEKDEFNNYFKLDIDKGIWAWKLWMFETIDEREAKEEIIEAEFIEEPLELGDPDKNPLYKENKILEIGSKHTKDKTSLEFKSQIINEINSWDLSFNLGMVVLNIISADKLNLENYKHLIEVSILCLQNELDDINKE